MTSDELRSLLAVTTPGPWRTYEEFVYDEHGCVAQVFRRGAGGEVSEDRRLNDARLIALAPTLAAELISLRTAPVTVAQAARVLLVAKADDAAKAIEAACDKVAIHPMDFAIAMVTALQTLSEQETTQ